MAKTITDIRHAALMAWHADAHPLMKNEDGTPKTFYHGTGRDIEKFLTKPGETTEGAAFFTSHPTVASGFARTQGEVEEDATPVVYPVHVHMKNPKVLNHTDVMKWHEHSSSWMHSFDAMSSAVQKARDEGHDGLYIKKVPEYDDEAPPSDQVAVFKPNQIKSVYNPAPNRRKHNISEANSGNISEGFFTEDEARAAFKKAYPDGWKMDKNRSGETPWKDGVHSADVIRHFGEDGSKTFIYGNHIPELNRFEIEYSEVHGEHGKGTYTNVLDKLRRHMTVVSDLPGNNSAKGAYKKLGAYEDRNGRYVLDQKKDIKEETMTKLTLTEAENKKKKAELLESVKDKDLMEATHTLLDSGLFELTESMFDDKLASPFAMDRLYIATHGTDAHRDQLLKDEDAMVRFGVAQRGHLTHLNALASDPHPMVRDQVARRGDEELAKKMSTDPHATVRSSAHNRLHELAADEQKKQAEVAESLKEAPHYERGTEIRLVEDGRFATVKAWFETKKQGVFYVVGFPDGKTDMLQESAVIALNEDEDFRSEHDANAALADSAGSPTSKKYKLKRGERVISGHDSEHEAMHAWKNMGDNKGVKIHCESVVDPETLVERHSDTEFAIGRELAAQHGDADEHAPSKPVKLKRRDGTVHSEHDDERSAMDAYKNEPDNKGMKIVRESITEVEIPMEEDFTIPVDGTGLKLDPVQLDQYDAEKAHANECPFCSGEDHENASDEEHQAAMAYHTQAAKAAPTLAEKHFQSRQYMRHQARLKGIV